MKVLTNMIQKKITILLFAATISASAFAQSTNSVNDPEKTFKEAKELFVKEQYALAYPLLAELRARYADNSASDHTYLNNDVNYYYIVCELKLKQPIAEKEAKEYIDLVSNEPRRQLLSYHLARFYYDKEEFTDALHYYERAGLSNLSNAEIADAKFERAYCYFNLKLFPEAKPLFDEIRQLPDNKYYIPANYYFGFISFNDKDFDEAMRSFKQVEKEDAYKDVVPYYIAEILYFQKKYDEALRYGQSILDRGGDLQYRKEMNLLTGQLYFEKKDYKKSLPLLEDYVKNNDKVSKEVLYELSYCYYQDKQLDKAIEGFKQLSSEKDSMGQNSMYLLGDCYLQTGEKENARTAFQYCASNSSNKKQQQVSRFNYAKLSYELGYQDIALQEIKSYLQDYPNSEYDTEAKEIAVGLLANTNNYVDAVELYESFSKPTPAMEKVYPRILYGRAVEMINDQQTDKADTLLARLLELPENNITPYANFWRGEIAYRNKSYDYAIRYLSFYEQSGMPALGEANPVTARYDLGYSWFQKENYGKALPLFEQVTKTVSPVSTFIEQDAYLRSADCYFMMKDFSKANSIYETAINNALPQSDYAIFQKAIIAGIRSSAEKIRILNSLTHLYAQSSLVPDVNMEISDTYIADQKFRDAIPYLTGVLKDPNVGGLKPVAYAKLGLCYYNINQNKQALENYLALIDEFPESPEAAEALDNIKNIYVEEGRPNDYVDLVRRTGKDITIPEADSLTYSAAMLKYNANDCAGAINGFNNYLSAFPEGAFALDANYLRSECYDKSKDWKNALTGYAYVNSKGLSRYFDRSTGEAARISYFELKDYAAAKQYFQSLLEGSTVPDLQLEALRGLVRCYYQLKDYAQANEAATNLLTKKGISTDDRAIALLVLAKSQQVNKDLGGAIASYKSLAAINKSAWGAEARYEVANCLFILGNLAPAEKAAMAAIKENGSYDLWVTKSYILLGDIFMAQKDYFNAKATYESVAKNSVIPEMKTEAQEKFERAATEEKENSKINN